MDFHPIASIYPLIDGDEYQELVADISAHGLIQDIILYQGKILDGRNRYRACQDAGVDIGVPVEFEGTPLESIQYVVSLNDKRRHLTSSQKAACEYRRQELVAGYADAVAEMERQAESRKGERTDLSQTFDLGEDKKQDDTRRVSSQRAEIEGNDIERLLNDAKIDHQLTMFGETHD